MPALAKLEMNSSEERCVWVWVCEWERWRDSKRYSSVADSWSCPLVPDTLMDRLEVIWSLLMFLLLQFPFPRVQPGPWSLLKEGSREIVRGCCLSTTVLRGARSFPKGLTGEWSLCLSLKQVKTLSQLRLPMSTIYILPITVVLCVCGYVCVWRSYGAHEKGQRLESHGMSWFFSQ